MNTKNFVIMSVLGIFILLSYYIFIIKSGFTKPKISVDKWWFGLDNNSVFMKFSIISATLAAIGFLYFQYYLCFHLESGKASDKILLETIIVLVASLLWAPLTYAYLRSHNKIWKILSSLVLGVTAFGSIAIAYFINDKAPPSTQRTLAMIGISLFIFHTLFVDFGIWNIAMWN